MGLHSPCLYRGSLGTHEDILGDIKGILHIPCRMVLWQVQCLKVIIILLYLRAHLYREAHLHEDALDFHQRHGQGMQMTARGTAPRQGNINLFAGQALLQLRFTELLVLLRNQLLQLLTGIIHNLADAWPVLLGKLPQASQDSGQLTLLAQVLYPDIIQVPQAAYCLLYSLGGFLPELFNLFFHNILLKIFSMGGFCAQKSLHPNS